MKNQISFEKKVRSFTAKRLVNVMIKGLEREWVKIDMATFGEFRDGICYGCAATNAICEILQKPFTGQEIDKGNHYRARVINADVGFLCVFEEAIDCLRRGNIEDYNELAKEIGMTLLPEPEEILLCLTTRSYKEYLKAYKKYASKLPRRKLKYH